MNQKEEGEGERGVHVKSYTDIAEVLDSEDGREDVFCLLVQDEDLPDGGGRLCERRRVGVLGVVEVEEGEEGACLCVLQRRRGVFGHGRFSTRNRDTWASS